MTVQLDAPPRPKTPRAPSHEAWLAMTPEQRAAMVASLPAEMPEAELSAPEGDDHFDAKSEGRDTLRMYFTRSERRIYVGTEVPVYYPDEDRFSPDLFAVCDVDTRTRSTWVVDAEGRGLDWVLEVLVHGNRRKDLEDNVKRYARLRIPEYFVFDRLRGLLRGWRLQDRAIGLYTPIAPRQGVLRSEVLGLDLMVEGRRLRFRQGSALVLAPQDIILHLEDTVTDMVMALEQAEERRAQAEQQRADAELLAEAERRRAEDAEEGRSRAEARIRELEAELAKLRGG